MNQTMTTAIRKGLAILFTMLPSLTQAAGLGTAFTYQGRLSDGLRPADGRYDFQFMLYDAVAAGSAVGGPFTTNAVPVSNGLFTVTLEFGSGVFAGADRWLEVSVRTNGAGGLVRLAPRQPLTPAPYSLYAPSAGTAALAGTATAVAPGSVATAGLAADAVEGSRIADGTITASDLSAAFLSNTFWRLDGNAGTAGGTQFLGTMDNQPLELKVNGQRAWRVEPGFTANLIGGSPENTVEVGSVGSMIGGGGTTGGSPPGSNYIRGSFNAIAGGMRNAIRGTYGWIGGGWGNTIDSNVSSVVIGGGAANRVESAGSVIAGGAGGMILFGAHDSVIGGGSDNSILTNAYSSTIAGGSYNTIDTNAFLSTIGGGNFSTIGSNAYESVIAGGLANTIQAKASGSVIGGGEQNLIQTNASYASLGGGLRNTVGASGAVIPGGVNNAALGQYTLAAGQRAKALNNGTFVWADSQNADFTSSSSNQFLIRAGGGVGINKTNPATALDVNGVVSATSFQGSGAGLRGLEAASLSSGNVTNAVNFLSSSGVGIGTGSPYGALLDVEGDIRLNMHDLYFREGNDCNHGVGWYGASKLFGGVNVDGPVLYGCDGGALGSGCATNLALRWRNTGNVSMDPMEQNSGTLAPGLTFGNNSGEGIASQRTPGGNQYGLDFYIGSQRRLSLDNSGHLSLQGRVDTLGATDLELRVNGLRAFRVEQGVATNGAPNVVGGSVNNVVDAGYSGSFIGGGGATNWSGNGSTNRVTASFAVIGGGGNNSISTNAGFSTIGGGNNNSVQRNATYTTIGGGNGNSIKTGATSGTISGGSANLVQTNASYAVVAGGRNNTVGTNSPSTTIGGGYLNSITANAPYASIPGGREAQASHYAQMAYAGGRFSNYGDAQASLYVLRVQSTGTSAYTLALDGDAGTQFLNLPTGARWAFDILVIGSQAGGASATFQIKGAIRNDTGTVAFIGVPAVTSLGADTGATGWTAAVQANDASDSLDIVVHGSGSAWTAWVANVRTVEVTPN
jgi:hypothetical protein